MLFSLIAIPLSALVSLSTAHNIPAAGIKPFDAPLSLAKKSSGLTVDLGYGIYQGYANESAGLNVWKGIRYAAPPTGLLRWQPPQTPAINRTTAFNATKDPGQCPQQAGSKPEININTVNVSLSSEDCLFLNVFAPSKGKNLPVFVWIHGGGYAGGNAAGYDPTALMNGGENQYLSVVIQYRLGSFGFLASDEVYRRGVVNAGLLDQQFALRWVQSYISKFGGDPARVTIGGESAGAGSVFLQDMAYGGSLGPTLFQNTFTASPFLPMQYNYNDWIPSQTYYAFAAAANCSINRPYGYLQSNQTIFDCLQNASTETLQIAGYRISGSGPDYFYAFEPVTDGIFVQERPSLQFTQQKLNGVNALTGNNADEGLLFVPQTISTEAELITYLHTILPDLNTTTIDQILAHYPGLSTDDNPNAPRYWTSGDSGATAVNQSGLATGHQQRANNIYAETTFVCPSYWIGEAYGGNASINGTAKKAYKYQYSIPGATHGTDLFAYIRTPSQPSQSPSFVLAFQRLLRNFIVHSDPSISNAIANGMNSSHPNKANAAHTWPLFSKSNPYMINLNETGGLLYPNDTFRSNNLAYTAIQGPGLVNNISEVNAWTWENGRGARCEFWRSIGALVPE